MGEEFDRPAPPPHFGVSACAHGSDIAPVRRDRQSGDGAIRGDDHFRLLFEKTPLPYQSMDANGFILEVNPTWLDTMGYAREEVTGRWFGDFVAPEMVQRFDECFPHFKQLGEMRNAEFKLIRKDGTTLLACFDGTISYDENGDVLATHCIFRDITEWRRMVTAVAESESRYRSLLEAIDDSIHMNDASGRYVSANSELGRRLGLPLERIIGRTPFDIYGPEQARWVMEQYRRVLTTGQVVDEEVHFARERARVCHVRRSPLRNEAGEVVGIVTVSRDVTELVRMREELRTLSLVDELTGLYNRRGFMTLADQQLRLAKRLRASLTLLMADLDSMKEINDNLGHQYGDRALMSVAHALKEVCRGSDVIGRLGGDEFAVLALGSHESEANVLARRLEKAVEAKGDGSLEPYRLSISIGTAKCGPESALSISDLLDRADRSMYARKRAKRVDAAGTHRGWIPSQQRPRNTLHFE